MEEKKDKLRIFKRPTTKEELSLGYVRDEDEEGEFFTMTGVPQKDRLQHFYIIGASGTGKTTFLEHLIWQDVQNKFGFGIIDPHGDLVKLTMEMLSLSSDLDKRVVLIDPTDKENTVCFNPLELTEGYEPSRQAKELIEVFKKIWINSWGDRMDDIFTNTLIALIENNLTLDEVPIFLTDIVFRAKIIRGVKNEKCREYFQNEFNVLSPKTRSEWITSTLDKVRTFLIDQTMRDIFLSPKSSFNFRDIIDNGKILLVRIPKGLLGEENSNLLGSLILSKIKMAALSRADTEERNRVPFYLYIDEFQNFATENFVLVLDETRKYKLVLTLAHQNLGQIPEKIKSSLLNCPLQAYFRVVRKDAEILAKEMFAGVYSNPQPWEKYFQTLQVLQDRTCLVKNRNGGGIVHIVVPPPFDLKKNAEEMGVGSMLKFWKEGEKNIGKSYLRKRSDIREEYAKRKATFASNDEKEGYYH